MKGKMLLVSLGLVQITCGIILVGIINFYENNQCEIYVQAYGKDWKNQCGAFLGFIDLADLDDLTLFLLLLSLFFLFSPIITGIIGILFVMAQKADSITFPRFMMPLSPVLILILMVIAEVLFGIGDAQSYYNERCPPPPNVTPEQAQCPLVTKVYNNMIYQHSISLALLLIALVSAIGYWRIVHNSIRR